MRLSQMKWGEHNQKFEKIVPNKIRKNRMMYNTKIKFNNLSLARIRECKMIKTLVKISKDN